MKALVMAVALLLLISAATKAGCPATMQWDRENFCILVQPFEQMHDQVEKTTEKSALVNDVGGAVDSFRKALDQSKDSPLELEALAVQALIVKLTLDQGISRIMSRSFPYIGTGVNEDTKKDIEKFWSDFKEASDGLGAKMAAACQASSDPSHFSFCDGSQTPFCAYVAKVGTVKDPHAPTTDNVPAILDGKALFKKICSAK